MRHDSTRKLGFTFRYNNKKANSKEKCLATISPLQNTFFKGSKLTMLDIFRLVMGFVSRLAGCAASCGAAGLV